MRCHRWETAYAFHPSSGGRPNSRSRRSRSARAGACIVRRRRPASVSWRTTSPSTPTRGVTAGTVDPAVVVDLTDQVTERHLALGRAAGPLARAATRARRSPARPTAPRLTDVTGLEIDKLDGARVAAYLESYLSRTFGAADADRGPIGALLSDSIEAGPQNWTERILEQFRHSRGYDPTPWLPALAGFIVGSAAQSDRFLFDYRRTISRALRLGLLRHRRRRWRTGTG